MKVPIQLQEDIYYPRIIAPGNHTDGAIYVVIFLYLSVLVVSQLG